jgi:hypothetical protein
LLTETDLRKTDVASPLDAIAAQATLPACLDRADVDIAPVASAVGELHNRVSHEKVG